MKDFKRITDPELGEMIGIQECAFLTGITTHTLRSWRKEDKAHLAKFDTYVYPAQPTNVLYRLADVELFMKENGVVAGSSGLKRHTEAPNAFRAPIVGKPIDSDKRRVLANLAKIQTHNAWYDWQGIAGEGVSGFNKLRDAAAKRLYALYKDVDPESLSDFPGRPNKDNDPEYYYVGNTLGIRRVMADKQSIDITDQELISLPIGDPIPMNEKVLK